jgi:diguanylate cyclase (GGDEF)-like protein/PAS domain S-box-containing protein
LPLAIGRGLQAATQRRARELEESENIARDRIERERTEAALQASETRYRDLFENANDMIFTIDLEGKFTSINKLLEAVSGYSREEALHLNLSQALTPESVEVARRMIREKLTGASSSLYEVDAIAKDGRIVHTEISSRLLYEGGRPVGVQGIARDLTERRRAEEALRLSEERYRYHALHDPLTGLPNRMLFADRLEQAIHAAQREEKKLAVLLMDLDKFKMVNDTLGHHVGDQVLREVGPKLQPILRQSDTVARWGGDEFVFLLLSTERQGAMQTVGKIVESLRQRVEAGDQSVEIEASVGIALFPDHGRHAQSLILRADQAMYAAKRARSGYAVFDPGHSFRKPAR